jgi:hypothetical protein
MSGESRRRPAGRAARSDDDDVPTMTSAFAFAFHIVFGLKNYANSGESGLTFVSVLRDRAKT